MHTLVLKLGLTKPEDKEHTYVQCVDLWKPYTDGGTVVFRVKKGFSVKLDRQDKGRESKSAVWRAE